ncbi:hypothetical protein KP79_PYT03504 [Mizuhopecten yessoensis]|uniref:Uncharacterized protein n=1 Tax=Mizuhopecten yessoensis TaxID=6573 RepID=A0A210PDA1_MIZYE|nr:hypothetical protein KP79_PYT03504 [Mizuhopecten yessoensis]
MDPSPAVKVVSNGLGNFQFLADPADQYGERYGVFMRAGEAGYVKRMCESGSLSGGRTTSTMKPDKNPAFKLTCK